MGFGGILDFSSQSSTKITTTSYTDSFNSTVSSVANLSGLGDIVLTLGMGQPTPTPQLPIAQSLNSQNIVPLAAVGALVAAAFLIFRR